MLDQECDVWKKLIVATNAMAVLLHSKYEPLYKKYEDASWWQCKTFPCKIGCLNDKPDLHPALEQNGMAATAALHCLLSNFDTSIYLNNAFLKAQNHNPMYQIGCMETGTLLAITNELISRMTAGWSCFGINIGFHDAGVMSKPYVTTLYVYNGDEESSQCSYWVAGWYQFYLNSIHIPYENSAKRGGSCVVGPPLWMKQMYPGNPKCTCNSAEQFAKSPPGWFEVGNSGIKAYWTSKQLYECDQ